MRGLNKYLQPDNTPVTDPGVEVKGLDFDTQFNIPANKIKYYNILPDGRPYAAVVSLSGSKGTFRDIQLAINSVNRMGGGTVFIRNGTYVIGQDLTLFSGVSLLGESQSATLDFLSQPYQIKVVGDLVYNTGTIYVNNNSALVSGSGTNWNSSMEGSFMLIHGQFYLIDTVTSTTGITLDSSFSGDNIANEAYLIADPVDNVSISNLTIQNSTAVTGSVYFEYTLGCSFTGFFLTGSTLGFTFKNSDGGTISSWGLSYCDNGCVLNNTANTSMDSVALQNVLVGDGISLTAINAFSLFNFSVFNALGRGVVITNSYNFGLIDFALISNTGIGLELVSSHDGNILSADILNNTTDGIKLTSNNDRNTITNVIIRANGGWGINVAASTCDDNLILGNILRSNTGGSVTDSGTTTLIRSNVGATDN